jgi:hypothetical protein
MDRQAAADFWQRRPPPPEPTHSRIYGGRSAGLPGTNSYWDNEAQRSLEPPPTKLYHSETEQFLRCVEAVVQASDAETASLCSSLPDGAASRDVWQPVGDMSHDATKAWYNERPLQNAPQLPRDATTRLGMSHARRKGLAVVPCGGGEYRLPCTATPELSRLLATPQNSLLHIAACRGLVATVSTLLSKGAAPDSRNAAGETPRDVANAAAAKRTASSNALSIVEKLGKAAAPKPQKGRARPTWTDAWFAVRDAPDEEARAVLVECLGLDGDLGRSYAEEEVRPALSAEDKRNMKLMQDRATATTRARHLAARLAKRLEEPDRDAIQLKAALKLQRAYRARHRLKNDAAASQRAKAHWATAARKSKALTGDAAARKMRDGRRELVNRRRLGQREWYDFCGATVGFTLAHLAAARDKPLCLALLVEAGADPDGPAIAAIQKRDEVTPRTLARDANSRRCLAVLGESLDVPPPPPHPNRCPHLGGATMRAVLGPPPQFRKAAPRDVWYRTFDDVRDSPDEQAAQAVAVFAKNASGRWGLDARRLDGYGPDAARTLAHAAAARGKVRTVAALRDAGANLELRDVNGFTCFDLLARAAATTADFHSVAAAVGIVIPEVAPPPQKRDPRLAKDRCWQALVDALRDPERKEVQCLPLAHALAGYGGADAFGRTAWHRPHGDSRTVVALASGRGFRKVMGMLGRTGVAARDTGELGVPGAGGLVAAR